METYKIISVLIFLAMVFAYVNARFIKWPSTIGIMVLALASSLLLVIFGKYFPWLSSNALHVAYSIDFEVVLMQIMLSFLLFAGAIHIDFQKLKKELLPVLVLATIGTLTSAFIVAGITYYLLYFFNLSVSFIHCLLFGALISPTDPIAVLGILKEAGIPKSLELKIAGESLFNDGVAVVLFLTILEIANTGTAGLSVSGIGLLFLQEAVGGLLYGAALGYAGYLMLKSIDDYRVEVLITLAVVMCGYSLANVIHVSAPLAMVVTGILIGNTARASALSEVSRDYLGKFWDLIDEIFNAVLFMLIGFEMLKLKIDPIIIVVGGILILLVLLSRYISIFLPIQFFRSWIKMEKNDIMILTWGGLRGGISVALALSIPDNMHRNNWVLITYIIVVFSIVVQGLSVGKLAKKILLKTSIS